MDIPMTDAATSALSVSKAVQACISCRKQKRKCDKTLPTCSLCARMGRQCDYTDAPSAPTADDLAVLQARLAELENRLTVANTHHHHHHHNSNGSSPAVTMEPSPGSTTSVVPPSDSDPSSYHSAGSSSRPTVNSRGPLWMSSLGMPTSFPSALFLDMDCFKWAGMHIPKPAVDVPPDVYAILTTSSTAIQDATTHYFESVHPWFPIISRKRMSIGTSLWEGGPDLAMLFLAMKLITVPTFGTGTAPADSPVYTAAKRFLALLESSGSLSLCHLQAMVLVALYEMGHGIYPSAWMSVAACARYVDVIGIPSFKDSSTVLGSCTTWTEMEERRRVWWAVYVLDRVLSLGNKKRCAMPEPDDHFVLPVDDAAWDAGDPGRAMQHPINTPLLQQPMGPFARTAQAAMLTSHILTHCRSRISNFRKGKSASSSSSPKDAADSAIAHVNSLLESIETLTAVTSSELSSTTTTTLTSPSPSSSPQTKPPYSYFSRLLPRCLVSSAHILLLDAYACPENLCDGPGASGIDADLFAPKTPSELAMQLRAVEGLRACSLGVRDLALELLEMVMLPDQQQRVSPLCLDALYCALATLHWLWKEGGDEDIRSALEDVRNCLSRLDMRWSLAGTYLDVMRFHDVTVAMALRASY